MKWQIYCAVIYW